MLCCPAVLRRHAAVAGHGIVCPWDNSDVSYENELACVLLRVLYHAAFGGL